MRVFASGQWLDGARAYHRGQGEVRIRVTRWATLAPVSGLYFVRPRSLRMIASYVAELGPREVLRKIRSRSGERLRNQKFVSIGIGEAIEGPVSGPCLFVAPMHPAGLDEVVVRAAAVRSWAGAVGTGPVVVVDATADDVPAALQAVEGWSPWSGVQVDAGAWDAALDAAAERIGAIDWTSGVAAPATPEAALPPAPPAATGLRAALYGYGNYAKLYVMPNITAGITLTRIAEIDPVQIPLSASGATDWSTAPAPPADDDIDVYFVAGYHSTHAPIAVQAILAGRTAVVEKPIAMDQPQLDTLLAALRDGSGRLYSCYNKRYSQLADWIARDVPSGAPVDYHCIVYEVPLPQRHWYRWPSSHTRILSNGCHWIDQFLYLNDFARPVSLAGSVSPSGTVNCTIELENGASFSMVLTEHGSDRLGVRDHIELRSGDTTIRMTDSTRYHAETGSRVIRKGSVNKADSYPRMYRAICAAIAGDNPGDSLTSIERSAQTIIDMERFLLDTPGGDALVQHATQISAPRGDA